MDPGVEYAHQIKKSGRGLDAWTRLAWMTGRRRDLAGLTPLDYVTRRGLDDIRARGGPAESA